MIFQIKAYDELEYIKNSFKAGSDFKQHRVFLLKDYAIVYIGKRKRYPWGLTRNNE